jgi:hypothetical protein
MDNPGKIDWTKAPDTNAHFEETRIAWEIEYPENGYGSSWLP